MEYGKHVIQPFGIVSADRENDSRPDGGSIPSHLPPCMIKNLVFIHFGRRQCPTHNGTKIQHKG
jgi:hypothetical protein